MPSAFNGLSQPALVTGREPGVFAGKNTALVGDKLSEEDGIFEIDGVDGEVDFRFRTRGSALESPAAVAVAGSGILVSVSFAGHKGIGAVYLISRWSV